MREIFARRMGLPHLSDDPQALTAAARTYLRQKFLNVPTAISGANFLVAETGAVSVVESEGNGRMCLTLPRAMITLAGIEKVLPRFKDLEDLNLYRTQISNAGLDKLKTLKRLAAELHRKASS